jgi:hypothetical protein
VCREFSDVDAVTEDDIVLVFDYEAPILLSELMSELTTSTWAKILLDKNYNYQRYHIIKTTNPDIIERNPYKKITDEELPELIQKYNSTHKVDFDKLSKLSIFEIPKYVYIVEHFGGEWSDSWQYLDSVWDDKEKAIERAEEYWQIHGNYLEKLPIPYNVYNEHIGEFENFFDEDVENFYEFEDRYGYTKEDWAKTNEIIEKCFDHSYSHTAVHSIKLNSFESEKEVVWLKYKIDTENINDEEDER